MKQRKEILKPEMPIIEATSGNTGIAIAALGKFYNHPVYIFMPDWVSIERLNLMKSFGANVKLFSKEEGGFIRCVEESKKMAKEKNGFLANQFANNDNFLAHYETTAEEIIKQVPEKIYGFVSGVGTGGTLMGVGKRLREEFKETKIVAIEPDKMPMISKGKIYGHHKIEGIGDDFVPELVDRNSIDEVILVNDEDSINMFFR
jgi:cysteine synthase A